MPATVTESESDTLTRVRAEIARQNLSQGAAAKAMGLSATTLNQLLKGSYGADPTTQLEKLERWLADQTEAQAAAAALPDVPDWVDTVTGERVIAALGYAKAAADVALIYGGAGLGKTSAIREFGRRYPNVWVATMNPATASVVGALEEVYIALGLKLGWTGGAARMHREICRKIQGSNGLLVIDEAQHLITQSLDAIRAIHDATGVGLALVGNETVFTRMAGGNRAAYLDRLHSRIGKRVKLTKPETADIEGICTLFGVTDKASLRLLRELGNKAGALRSVVKVLRLASMIAGGASLGASHIEAAWRELGV